MSKRAREENEMRVEKHDGGFSGPLVMFPTFPHNETFEESREIQINATPVDEAAEVYTFIHHNQSYGVIKTEDAIISAKMKFKTTGNGNAPAADQIIAPIAFPLRLGWKSKEVYVNNELIHPTSTHESELVYVNHLLTEVPSGYKDSQAICMGYHDTPGQFDDRTRIDDVTEDTCVNIGAGKHGTAFNNGAENLVIDKFDVLGHNKRYVPSSFEIKIVLTRLEKTKAIFGTKGPAGPVHMCMNELQIRIPVFKPVQQLSEAINEVMIQKGDECKYYVTTHRYVPTPIAAGAQRVQVNDIFNGARPTRCITYVKTQARYNGSHELNTNLLAFPDINHFAIKINEAVIPPVIRNSKEAYFSLRQILDCRYSENAF
jgi:hypothetical protein